MEEIPRFHVPEIENKRRPLGRAVTLSGNYNIPLPTTVREEDLDAIKRGINSAQNLARNFMDERRTTMAFRNEISKPTNLSYFLKIEISLHVVTSTLPLYCVFRR